MKKLILLITFGVFVINGQASSGRHFLSDDSIIVRMASLDLTAFNSKPVDSLIAKIPSGYTSMKICGGSRTDIAGMLLIEYPNDVFIQVHVWEFTHMNPENPNKLPPAQAWSVALFKKEKVGYIKAFNGSDCINGCENR